MTNDWCRPRMGAAIALAVMTIALALTLAACSVTAGAVSNRSSLPGLAQTLSEHSRLYLPQTPGPHPVVIYMHGCKRHQSHADLWGQALAQRGYAMVMIDSFSHRDIGRMQQQVAVCTGLHLPGAQRSADVWAALYMVDNGIGMPTGAIDTTRVGAMGFSHGAWSIMDMMALWSTDDLPLAFTNNAVPARAPGPQDLDALILVYPWCKQLSLTKDIGAWRTIPPTHFVRPNKDMVVGTQGCDKNIGDLGAAGQATGQGPVTQIILDANGHAFDEPDGAFMPFDAMPTQAAIASVIAFLDATL